jgi:hypothetical protein
MSNLHDIKIPNLAIKAEGKEYTLTFDLNTFAEIEEKYGGVFPFFDEVKKFSPKAIRFLLWNALQDKHSEITEKEAGRLLGLGNVIETIESIVEIFNGLGDSLPQIADEIKNLFPSQASKTPTTKE